MLVQGPVVQGEGSTHPVESHHTPTSAPPTSQPPISSTSRRLTRQDFVVPRPKSLTQTNVADEAASISVDVRYGGAATTVTGLEVGQGSGNIDKTPTMPHDSPLPRVSTLGSDEGKVQGRHEYYMESDFSLLLMKKFILLKKKLVPLSQFPLLVLVQSKTRAKIDEEERQRIVRVQEEVSSFNIKEWDDIQARVESDEEFA
ncbi:hypothetical protein Tco_1303733 [Tanacetum coccineum]